MIKHDFSPDVIVNDFWKNNDRFADLFNTVMFDGKTVLKPEHLTEKDSAVSAIIRKSNQVHTLKRTMDVVKKSALGTDFVIFNLENQQKIHYAMPLRSMIYNGNGYLNEYRDISALHKKEWELVKQNGISGGGIPKKQSRDEFLSEMNKEDRLHPIVSLVLYYGEEPWDGPLSLRDMMVDMPDEISEAFSDYKMHLIQIRDVEQYNFSNSDVQSVFSMCNYFYKYEVNQLLEEYGNKKYDFDVLQTVAAITNSRKLMSMFSKKEEGGATMCGALELWEKEARERGEAEGRAIGMKAGMEAGMEAGMQAGLKAMIETCMEVGLSEDVTLSNLISKMSLEEADAKKYMAQYWRN